MEGSQTTGQLPVNAGEKPPKQEKEPVRRARVRSNYPLPSERIPFDSHFEVLRRFVSVAGSGKQAVPSTAVEGPPLKGQAAMLNTGFLVSLGLLIEEERGKFRPSDDAVRFVMTRQADPERARPILRALIEKTWFADAARSLVLSKPAVSESDLVTDLAIVAQTDIAKKEQSIRILIDYLVFSGYVVRSTQGLTLGTNGTAPIPATSIDSSPGTVPVTSASSSAPAEGVKVIGPISTEATGWKTIQTNDFYVKVRADKAVVARLRKYLDLIDEELPRTVDEAIADTRKLLDERDTPAGS